MYVLRILLGYKRVVAAPTLISRCVVLFMGGLESLEWLAMVSWLDILYPGENYGISHLYWFGIGSALLAVAIILTVCVTLQRGANKTFVNQLMETECLLRLTNIQPILYYTGIITSTQLCGLRVTFTFGASLLTRLLTVGIAIYRWVYVCHSTWVLDAGQRKRFDSFSCWQFFC